MLAFLGTPGNGPELATGADGRAERGGLAEGLWVVSVRHPQFLGYDAQLRLEAGKRPIADKEVQVGVLDIRSMMIETPEQIAARARQVLEHVPAERVTLSTDCGMKPLPRPVAKLKLKALAEGAAIVRNEL